VFLFLQMKGQGRTQRQAEQRPVKKTSSVPTTASLRCASLPLFTTLRSLTYVYESVEWPFGEQCRLLCNAPLGALSAPTVQGERTLRSRLQTHWFGEVCLPKQTSFALRVGQSHTCRTFPSLKHPALVSVFALRGALIYIFLILRGSAGLV